MLYDLTRPKIIAYAIRRTPTVEDAADVVAETYTIAWRRFDDVPSGEPSLLWLYATARRVAANSNRRYRRQGDLVERMREEFGAAAMRHAPMGDPESAVGARAILDQLSDDDRELLMLSGWEGLDSAQLGIVLGCSPTAARIRLFRARSRLSSLSAAGDDTKQITESGHRRKQQDPKEEV